MGADSADSDFVVVDNAAIKECVDNIEALLKAHEQSAHEGKRCDDERGNVIAYVIHRMGYGPATALSMTEHLRSYMHHHQEQRDGK